MNPRSIVITSQDMQRLQGLLSHARQQGAEEAYLEDLETELDRASVVTPENLPGDIITMNSTVSLRDLDSGEASTYQLVYPQDADLSRGKVSILAPIGTAMLGYAVGDRFDWLVPAGVRRLRVDAVLYQPEAAGDLHL